MKKLKLFISLWFTMFSVAVFAQAEFEKIAITQNTLDNSAGRLIVQDATTGELKYILKSVLDNKFNQPTGNATQYLDGAGTPTAFPVLGQADRVITEVRNTTGATVVKGTVIYLSGASGGKATIQKAQANAESTSSGTFGVIQSDINNNSNGYAVVIGTVLGVNTSSYTEGQVLWLSPTVAGGFTSTKPVAPNHAVYVAIVTLAATNGTIEVKVQNGYEIDELHDVLITSKANNDAIVYDSASGLWKNKQLVADAIADGTTTVAPSQNAVFDALAAKENTSSKNVANGYAGLGSDGKLFSTQLPSITITDTFVVGSQAAMLALTAETGDVAVRTDVNKSFILKGSDPAVLANWQELLTPTSAVTSVFGRNGAVTAQNGDYTTALVTETTNKRYQTDNQQTYNDATSSIQTQLNAKENLSNKSTITTLGTSDTLYPTQNAVKTYVDTKVGGGVGSLEFNSTDLTVWNNGKSNVDTNTSFGEGALRSNTTGGWNTAYGQSTLYNNTTGNFNTAVGLASLPANQTGQLNTALGYGSLNTSLGNQNTGLGAASLGNTSSGSNNLASGYNSLGFNTTGSNNVALGTSAGSYISPSGNNVITNQSVYLGAETRTFANNQTNEIVVGYGAIGNGSNSVTLGNSSITKTVLKGNVGIGNTGPLTSLEVASNSSSWISGTFSGTGNTDKVVIGNLATPAIGGHNSALTAWSDFTIAGANILFSPYGSEKARITSLGLQTVGGQDGGIRVQTNGAAINLPTTGLSFSTGFSVGYIRNANSSGSVADLYIEALKVNFQNLGTGLVYSNGGFLTSTNPSDRRLKDNILNLQYGLNEILKLRPVSYNWKDDKINQGKQFGFIAQEVQEVMPELVKEFETKEGERLGLDKDGIYAALVKAIQEQQTQIKELRKEIEILKNK